MKILVLYDSQYGNTKKIAEAISEGCRKRNTVKLLSVSDAEYSDLTSIDLFIAGSPTRGGRPTEKLFQFINELPIDSLTGIRVAAFDTRFSVDRVNFFLKILMKIIDYAALKIAITLVAKGGKLAAQPEGFIVTGKSGPLESGEISRATSWATSLMK